MTLNEIGELLRRRREELGLSLRDAQTATKIRWRYLEALERGDDSVMPGYVYAKGFLRTYAEYLGLDGWALVEAYKQVREGPQAGPQQGDRGRGRRPRDRVSNPAAKEGPAEVTVRMGAAPPLTLPPRRPPAGRRRGGAFYGVVLLGVLLAAALIGVYYLYLAAQQPPDAAGPDGGGSAAEEPAEEPEVTVPSEPPPEPEPAQPEPAGVQYTVERSGSTITYRLAAEALTVDVAVEARCWVRVEADGVVVSETTLQPGQQVTWQAQETLRVRVGNPPGLRLSVAGTPLELDASDAVTLVFVLDT